MPETMDQMITTELSAGRLATASAPTYCHTSTLGLIPQPHQLDKFQLTVDLSAPQGSSINDGIDPRLCSLEYTIVDLAARLAWEALPRVLMYKLDLSNTY